MYNQNKKSNMHVHVKVMLFVFILFFTKTVYSQNSENITQIGLWQNESCLAVTVTDTLAFVAAGLEGMYIIDVSNPSDPIKISSIKSLKEGKATCIEVRGSYAYVVYENSNSHMVIIDITDPRYPKEVGAFGIETYIYDIAVNGSYAYIAAAREGLHIVDISNPEVPRTVSIFNTEAFANSVEIKDSYAYLADNNGWGGGKGLHILDITNPLTPEEISLVEPPFGVGGTYTLTISGSFAYIIWWSDTATFLHTIDISNPSAPIDTSYSAMYSWARSIAVDSSYAYLAMEGYGLQMLDNTNIPHYSWENLKGYFKTNDVPHDVVVNGLYVYLIVENKGLYILQNDLLVGVNETLNEILQSFTLEQNYPNPFNPTTKITYQIPENRMVTLKVFNMLGQEVTTLVNEIKSAGKYTVTFNADNLSSGMYIYRMQSGNFTESKKILFLK